MIKKRWNEFGIFNITEYRQKGWLKIDDANPVSTLNLEGSLYFGQKANNQYNGLGRR